MTTSMNSLTIPETYNPISYIILGNPGGKEYSKSEISSFQRMAEEIQQTAKKVSSYIERAFVTFGIFSIPLYLFFPFTWPVIVLTLVPLGIAWIFSKIVESQAKAAAKNFKNILTPETSEPPTDTEKPISTSFGRGVYELYAD
jgi:hypothetical protein